MGWEGGRENTKNIKISLSAMRDRLCGMIQSTSKKTSKDGRRKEESKLTLRDLVIP